MKFVGIARGFEWQYMYGVVVLIWVACVGFELRLQTYMVLVLCLFCGCGVVGCVRLFILFAWLDLLGVLWFEVGSFQCGFAVFD